jgi:CheY-like chemotaxis protein
MHRALILIIDPSRETRTIYADYFRHYGYAVAEAADGDEGAELARSLRPNLIVTELSEEEDWVRAIRVVREDGTTRETAIIACSSLIEASWPCAPAGVQVDSALPKPTSPRTLLGEVQRLLAHGAQQPMAIGA